MSDIATDKITVDWLKGILVEKKEWAEQHAGELLQLLGKQLIQNKKDLATASRETLEKCKVGGDDLPGIIIDLMHKASSHNQNQLSGLSSAPGHVFDPVGFQRRPLKYPTFEPNGDSIKMVGRKRQIKKLVGVVSHMDTKPKMEVVIISSTRGMGKTFFLKKACLLQHGPIYAARRVGRIITIEAKAGCDYFLQDLNFSYFWPRVIVLNILEMFDECIVGGIYFQQKAPDTIARWSVMYFDDISREGPLAQWVHKVVQGGISMAISELIRLTNIAFGVEDNSKPVLLLDNVHELAKRQLEQVSTRNPSLHHTYLSKVLDNLTVDRPICIVAGTTDGAINLLAEYSNFVPVHIHLTPIGSEHWNEMGRNIVEYLNGVAQPPTNIAWPRLNVDCDAPIVDELALAIEVAPQITPTPITQVPAPNTPPTSRAKVSTSPGDVVMSDADLGSSGDAVVKDEFTDDELMNMDGVPPAVFSEDTSILFAMIYATCQVPRMMYIAVQSWYWGKVEGWISETITNTFEVEVQKYYQANSIPNNITAEDLALLLLACNVHLVPQNGYLLPNKFSVTKLVDDAVIFPYTGDDDDACSYVMPGVLWHSLATHPSPVVRDYWSSVQEHMHKFVPGLRWDRFAISFSRWWLSVSNLTTLGHLWEDIVAASLVVKYMLRKLHVGRSTIRLSNIYDLAPKAQAAPVLSEIFVDFSQGLRYPKKEVTVKSKLEKCLYVNRCKLNAHHDLIAASTPLHTAIQCKNSLLAPHAEQLQSQMGDHPLLWFAPGINEDNEDAPVHYQSMLIQEGLRAHKVGFLSGAGCVCPFTIDFLLVLKGMLKQRHESLKVVDFW